MAGRLTGIRVLVVEDDSDLRALFRLWLEDAGASVREADDGFEALRQVMLSPPDVILCDLHMPGMDGCAFVERMNQKAHLPRIPVIAVTGIATREALLQTFALGFAGHLVKPVTHEAIRAQIERVLRR